MTVYLTSYLCKPEYTVSELMKMSAKEVQGQNIMQQLSAICNVVFRKYTGLRKKQYQNCET